MPAKKASRTRRGKLAKARPARKAVLQERPHARQKRVQKIIGILERSYPSTPLALNFTTPLELLIALILAAQCTDERVNAVTAGLFKKYLTPQDWAGLNRETLETEIRSTGFYRNKAKAVQDCCAELVKRFGGEIPRTLEELIMLPGVGRKTANILRGNAFGEPAIGVDTHVGRLAQRMGLSLNTDPDKIESDLNTVVPDKDKVRLCHLLQAHGRAICLARKPHCPDCSMNHLCPYPKQAHIPIPATR